MRFLSGPVLTYLGTWSGGIRESLARNQAWRAGFLVAVVGCGAHAKPSEAVVDDRLIVPETLDVAPRGGDGAELTVVALTLRDGPTSLELYAALENVGTTPACSPAFSFELSDSDEQPLGAGLGGLLLRSFYALESDPNTIAGCVAPGETSMVAVTDGPAQVHAAEVAHLSYALNYWNLPVQRIDGITIADVSPVAGPDGVRFTGALVNGFDRVLSAASVAVFPLTAVGRPLGVARARNETELGAGDRWQFETDSVAEAGASQAAYPASGL